MLAVPGQGWLGLTATVAFKPDGSSLRLALLMSGDKSIMPALAEQDYSCVA